MAVKEKLNKSEEVRKLHKSGVKSASEIMAKLKARNITVAPAQVYAILAGKKGKKKAKKAKQQETNERSGSPSTTRNRHRHRRAVRKTIGRNAEGERTAHKAFAAAPLKRAITPCR